MREFVGSVRILIAGTALGLCAFWGALTPLEAVAPSPEMTTIPTVAGPASLSGSIRGTILDENGQPVEGAVIRVTKPGEDHPEQVTESNDQGVYSLPEVNAGLYILDVAHADFSVDRRVVIVAYEGRSTMNVTLHPEDPR